MRKAFYFLFLSLSIISCSTESEQPEVPGDNNSKTKGKQAFSIAIQEISAKTTLNNNTKNLIPAFALVSISDEDGNVILTRQKIVVRKVETNYVTDEITLDAGNYSLTEFIVTDADNVVISLIPMANSVLSEQIENTLPFSFTVQANASAVTATENIDATGYTSFDFGYTGLSLTFPDYTDFFSIIVDDSEVNTTKVLNLKSITGSTYLVDWGDGTIDEYVSTINNSGIENIISHNYAQVGLYTITVSGAIEDIELLDFGSNQDNNWESHLTSIDIDKLRLLKSCQLYFGKLTSLNTSENEVLEFLGLGYNQVTSLDLTNNPKLKSVWLRYNRLTELDISNNLDLEFLWVTGNQLAHLDISNNTKLTNLTARENVLTSINLANNPDLYFLDLSDNFLSSIDVSANLKLTEINVGANQLTSIDISQNTNLVRVDLYTNQIAAIDLSANLLLRHLYISNNLLTEIDLSANSQLERLTIENNNFSILDITANPKIFSLEIGINQFAAAQLDQILSQVYNQAVLNSVMNGYIDYKNNPGFDEIDPTTIAKLNELVADYNWFFNNN